MSDEKKKDVGEQNAPGESTRFKKGQSGNPAGRPPGISFKAMLRTAMAELSADGTSPATRAIARFIAFCDSGDLNAIKVAIKLMKDLDE